MNGVTHSILRVLEHLQERGDEVLVIAPSTQDTGTPNEVYGAHVHRLPSVPLAGYANVRVAMGGVYRVKRILAGYAPDVVHLASPFVLGWRARRPHTSWGSPPSPSTRPRSRATPPAMASPSWRTGRGTGWRTSTCSPPEPSPPPASRSTSSAAAAFRGSRVAARRGHGAVLPGQARRRMAGSRRPSRRAHHRLRGPARGRKTGAGPRRARRCPRDPAGDCGRRTPASGP